MPPYVMLSEEPVMHHHLFDAMGPGYLGVSHSPFPVLLDSPFRRFDGTGRSTTASLADDRDVIQWRRGQISPIHSDTQA